MCWVSKLQKWYEVDMHQIIWGNKYKYTFRLWNMKIHWKINFSVFVNKNASALSNKTCSFFYYPYFILGTSTIYIIKYWMRHCEFLLYCIWEKIYILYKMAYVNSSDNRFRCRNLLFWSKSIWVYILELLQVSDKIAIE